MDLDITWYNVLGVLPGCSQDQIKSAYDAKVSQLRPQALSGAPSPVITAASRAQQMLDAAWSLLGDQVSRKRYDEAVGVRRSGGGLAPPDCFASQPGWDLADAAYVAGAPGAEALGVLMELTDWLAPRQHHPTRLAVPDVRGLFYSVCLEVVGRLDLRLTAVRLTEHPMPVDGLVVDQTPRPPAKVRRDSELRVHVWHPPERRSWPRP
jgi:hypothetical protein